MTLWTPDESADLLMLAQDGKPVAAIARKLNRSIGSVYDYAYAIHGGLTAIRRGIIATRSLNAVSQLFGVTYGVATAWVEQKALKASRNSTGRKAKFRHYLVSDEALLAFIEDRTTWPRWSANLITDRDWREHAEEVRKAAGGDWLTPRQIGIRYDVTENAANDWIRTERLSALKLPGGVYVWSADLDGFVPPGVIRGARGVVRKQQARGAARRAGIAERRARVLAAMEEIGSCNDKWKQAAERTGLPQDTCRTIWRRWQKEQSQ